MDKINLAHWNQVFGKTSVQQVFATQHYSDHCFQFEEPGLANGSIRHVATTGMQLIELSLNANQPIRLVEEDLKESAESVFIIDGAAESGFQNFSSALHLKKNNHNLQYNPAFGGEHLITSPCFHAFTVSYEMDFLHRILYNEDNHAIAALANSLEKKKTWMAAKNSMDYESTISDVLHSIRNCAFTGVTRYIYFESKMLELFVLQMEQANSVGKNCQTNWSSADRDKFFALNQFIENAYLEDFSLKDLTYKFGLNEFKLKKGYKDFFDSTVFGHVHRLRMQKAKALLTGKEMNVTEASYFVGYNNVSSFCTEFKKTFGYSPGKVHLN